MEDKLTENEQKVLMIIWDIPYDIESKYFNGVTFENLQKATNLEKSELQRILTKLENKSYIEHRIFTDGNDYSVEQRGIDFCMSYSKKRINVQLLKFKSKV